MAGSAIADNVLRYDIGLSCSSNLLTFHQRQLLLYGQLLMAGSIITGNVVGV
jgi:hypothetical protein